MEINKLTATKTFSGLFNDILTGNKENSRKAAREVRKLLYGCKNREEFEKIEKIIEDAPNKYDNILEDWRQENFVISISILYFLHGEKIRPDFLFPWLLYLFQHKNGNVRQSAIRMIGHELGALTVHIRCPDYMQSTSKIKQSDTILLGLFISLNNLLAYLWNPKYKKYKYIASLPTCPYKSAQFVLCDMEHDCGAKYMKRLKEQQLKIHQALVG